MRILYAPGPIDVPATYQHWIEKTDESSSVATSYLMQFLYLCDVLAAEATILSLGEITPQDIDKIESCRAQSQTAANIQIKYCPLNSAGKSHLFFYLAQISYLLRLSFNALRFRADVVVVTPARKFLFVLLPLAGLGIRVVPSLHCTFWPKMRTQQSVSDRILLWLNSRLLKATCFKILAFPGEVSHQVVRVSDDLEPIIRNFLPSYNRKFFDGISPPRPKNRPFRILYLGRITRDKGIYTLLQVAARLQQTDSDVVFDICGDGPDLDSLRLQLRAQQLEERIKLHGFCQRSEVMERLNSAHALIVPTTSQFIEGFNKVVAEGILAGRPVIASSVCPSLETVREAVVEVAPDDPAAYTDAVLALYGNPDLYQQKCQACIHLREKFLDTSHSWLVQLRQILEPHSLPSVPAQRASVPNIPSAEATAPGSKQL